MDPYILALMEDGLDEVLQNECTVSDGDALMDSEDEADLLAASRCSDQYGGNRPFTVNMERIAPIRR